MKSYDVTIQIKPLQQCFHLVLLVLIFESIDETLSYGYLNKTL